MFRTQSCSMLRIRIRSLCNEQGNFHDKIKRKCHCCVTMNDWLVTILDNKNESWTRQNDDSEIWSNLTSRIEPSVILSSNWKVRMRVRRKIVSGVSEASRSRTSTSCAWHGLPRNSLLATNLHHHMQNTILLLVFLCSFLSHVEQNDFYVTSRPTLNDYAFTHSSYKQDPNSTTT